MNEPHRILPFFLVILLLGCLAAPLGFVDEARAESTSSDEALAEDSAREECEGEAKNSLYQASKGLRTIELISHIAPLLGLLGTVLGMIEAFQRLQESGNQADPSILAGGIWEALLTTAAGMAVAIVATVSLSFFDNIIDRLRNDLEDLATQIFTRKPGGFGV